MNDREVTIDVLFNHQASSAPGAPHIVRVVELARVSDGAECLTDDWRNNTCSQWHDQDFVAAQLGVFFDGRNTSQFGNLFQNGAQGVNVEVLLPVRHDLG